jgi:hydrophobe/amphiphile efflux-1 (HAE1) family protein
MATTADVEKLLRGIAGVERTLVVNGYNILNGAVQPNTGLVLAALKPWDERKSDEMSLRTIIRTFMQRAGKIPDAVTLAFNPPPIPGLGSTGGFVFKLQDRLGGTPEALAQVADAFVAEARKRPEIGSVYSKFDPRTPSYRLDLDRERVKKLGVPLNEVSNALQTFLGGLQVNDFSRFGRTYKVTMQAEPEYRSDIKSIGLFHVRGSSGDMVPLSTLLTPVSSSTPTVIMRYNLFPAAEIGGDSAPGYSSGQAIAALEEVAKTLPAGYGYEWSGISLQEKESSGKAPIVFGIAVVFVFLFLAALYESWSVPFAVLFAVPLGVLGAMVGLYATGLNNNLYAQIGLILLIGLAAKNAILIVEFAKMKRDAGTEAVEAAVDAAKLRLRPILMTSFAFILGVVPLVIARGAGAGSRVSMGITVFSGMLAATFLAIFTVPMLYVAIDRVASRFGGASKATKATEPGARGEGKPGAVTAGAPGPTETAAGTDRGLATGDGHDATKAAAE